MLSPDREPRYIPYKITAGSVLKEVLAVLDPKRSNPELDFQIGRLVRLKIETSEDVIEAQTTVATIGMLQEHPQ